MWKPALTFLHVPLLHGIRVVAAQMRETRDVDLNLLRLEQIMVDLAIFRLQTIEFGVLSFLPRFYGLDANFHGII